MEVEVAHHLGEIFDQLFKSKSGGDADAIHDLSTSGAVQILELKETHRRLCENNESLRESTSDSKVQLDQTTLQLQNLLYEKHHYEKEIRSCTSFRSEYTDDQLGLLPVKEFASTAPDLYTPDDAHQLMLNRLEHELALRKAKLKELEKLKSKRDALAASIAQRRSNLAGLDSEIAKLFTTSVRIQKQYSINITTNKAENVDGNNKEEENAAIDDDSAVQQQQQEEDTMKVEIDLE